MDMIVHKQNTPLFEAQAMSASASSAAVNINSFSLYSVQFRWSGYTTGTVNVYTEATNEDPTKAETEWNAVDSFIVSTLTTKYMLNVEKAGYAWVRVRFESTSGTGTITATFNGKVL